MSEKSVLAVSVEDVDGNVVSDARVELAGIGPLRLDKAQSLFISDRVDAGDYVLKVDAEGYLTERVTLRVEPPGLTTTVMLGREGQPYYVVSGRRIYYPRTDAMAAIMVPPAQDESRLHARQAMRTLGVDAIAEDDERRQPGEPVIVMFSRHAAARAQSELGLRSMIEMPEVLDIGPVVQPDETDVRFLSRTIEVVTEDGVGREELEELVRPFGLHVVSQDALDPRLYTVATDGTPDDDYGSLPERLAALLQIRDARSVIAALVKTSAINPSDALFPLQYHLLVTRVPEAWEKVKSPQAAESFGSADVTVAVSDSGISIAPIHPAFSGPVTGGANAQLGTTKVIDTFNFHSVPMSPGNGPSLDGHGSGTSGVISAAADAEGVVGIAANTRLASYMFAKTSNGRMSHMMSYAAGINPGWLRAAPYGEFEPFPFLLGTGAHIAPGAAIINCSHTFSSTMTSSMERSLQRLTLFGRDRRGTLLFAAAHNEDRDLRTDGSWAETTNVIRVAASALDVHGEEVRASYSNYSRPADPVLDFCMPSSSANVLPTTHQPPRLYGLLSASTTTASGNARRSAAAAGPANVVANAVAGTLQLQVSSTAQFAAGQMIIVRDKDNPLHAELHQLAGVAAPNLNLQRDLGFSYTANKAEVIPLTGSLAYSTRFGGTSAATPQASAVAALMLSVNPALSWLELRQLMRDTTVPTALRYRGSTSAFGPGHRYRWRDPAGLDLIDGSGLLIIPGAGADRTIAAAAGPLSHGTRILALNDNTGISARQALVIGAETKLNGAHPLANKKQINVDRSDSFEPGDKIFIGRDVQTVMIRGAAVNDTRIWVQSVDGIAPNDSITLAADTMFAQTVKVLAIRKFAGSGLVKNTDFYGEAETRLDISPKLASDFHAGTLVTLADAHGEGPFTVVSKAAGQLTLNANVTRAHPDDRMVRKEGTEVRAVIRTLGGNQVEIDPLHNSHPFNNAGVENVRIGRIAHYGLGFGRGRIDAAEAVQAAKDYTHDERDLVVRNHLLDQGTNPSRGAKHVESPDLWARNTAPSPNAGTDPGEVPHEQPEITVDPAIHLGTGPNDLEVSGKCTSAAEVTFVIEIESAGATDKFKWSRNGAAPTAGVGITAAAQALSDGVSIRFNTKTGHVVGDRWVVRARKITNRFAHIRIWNRGTQKFFERSQFAPPASPNKLDVARRRLMLCVSDGYPVSRYVPLSAKPGPNDLEVVAPYSPPGGVPARSLFTIEITTESTSGDRYTWHRDGVDKGEFPITNGEITLEDGVKIRFGSTAGHRLNDRWNLYARAGDDAFLNLDHYWDSDVPPAAAPFPAELFDPATGRAGTRTLLSQGVEGLAANTFDFTSVTWPEALRPPTNNPNNPRPAHPRRFFLLGETVPHDGKLAGFTPKDNNNISFREITFAKFRFAQNNHLEPLDDLIEVDNIGSSATVDFHVEVRTTCGTFRAERVQLEFISNKGGMKQSRIFRFDRQAAKWDWNTNPGWATVGDPLEAMGANGVQTKATGEQFDMSFQCSVTLDKSFAEATVVAQILSDFRDHPVAAGLHTFVVIQAVPLPTGTGAAQAAVVPKPASFVFADTAALTQSAQQAFGPVAGDETNRYRVTALFTAGSASNAYAVTNGLVAIQLATNGTINLFLRPLRQPIGALTPIKYFVYRGFPKDDWLDPTDAKQIRGKSGASPFLTKVWETFEKLNGMGVPMPATVFGYDPNNQLPAQLLDDVFFRVGGMQLPVATEGIHLATFEAGKTLGFEIVFEEGDYSPTFDAARKPSYEVDITALPNGTAAEQFERRRRQEEILNFIDPAAFYGLHMNEGGVVRARMNVSHKGEDIYTQVVDRFFTENHLYVDVRSDNGSSLAFHCNYTVSGNELRLGPTSGNLTAQPYATHGWPIVSFANAAAVNTTDAFNLVFLELPRKDNENPVVYVEHGQLTTPATDGSFIRDTELNTSGDWTKEIGFEVPNTGPGGAKKGVAWLLRLFYGRLEVANRTVPIPNTVLQTTKFTDNVFGPIDRAPKWKGSQGIKWLTTHDNRYVDAKTDRAWRQMMRCGMAVQTSGSTPRVLLYALATARDIDPNEEIEFAPVRSLPAGVSTRSSFFTESALFANYGLEIDQIDDGGIVRTLQLQQAPKDGYEPSSALLLGLTQAELNKLAGFAPGLSKNYLRTLVLGTKTDLTDPRPSTKYLVGVQGLETADGEFEAFFPSNPGDQVFVYTVDHQFFASKAFAAAEPLPTTYTRNYEEAMGTRIWPQREAKIAAVDPAAKTIALNGVDWTGEVFPGSKIRISKSKSHDGEYDVTNAALQSGNTIITVTSSALKTDQPLGSVFTIARPVEERMIDLDQAATLGGFSKTRTLVDAFVNGLAGIANGAAAKASIETRIDAECAQILGRARARVQADRAHAENHERVLYWARNRMVVALKSHPLCLSSLSARNELLLRLEQKSRGYEIDFAGAPQTALKIVVTGFDPFELHRDIATSNPSGAVALALHGRKIDGNSKSAFIQTAIFPVRYRDFDANRVESVLKPFLRGGTKADMILTISQNGSSEFYDLERFAGRQRGGFYDNEHVTQPPHAVTDGNEFYQTTLPPGPLIPGAPTTPPAPSQKVFFDQSYVSSTGSFPEPTHTPPVPKQNEKTESFPLSSITGTAITGSGSNYLSNEIFYRVARERERAPVSTTLTGHFHIPAPKYAKVGIESVIAEVEALITNWLNSLP